MSSSGRRDIRDVFTPRRGDVNREMYVSRPELESALVRAIKGSMHALLFGESGNGKSWLYKNALEQQKIPFVVANCANAKLNRSVVSEILSVAVPPGTAIKISYSEEKGAQVKALVAEGGLKHQAQFELRKTEPLLLAFKELSGRIGKGPIVVVLDNLEAIFTSQELMDELASIIILLDDPRFSSCGIKFLVVGTPSDVLVYFEKLRESESVSNRLEELPKVDCLNYLQTRQIVEKGFVTCLKVVASPEEVTAIGAHVYNITMGVAQRVHEYCEILALLLLDHSWRYDRNLLERADYQWLRKGLRQSYTVVEGNLNSRNTTIARKNQVIYSIGRLNRHQFDTATIEKSIRENFKATDNPKSMGISSILGELSSGEKPLLVRNPKLNQYRVRDPRFVMCIRVILYVDKGGKVKRKYFKL